MVTRLVAGCGYVGMRVAQRWLNSGDMVYAFTRSTIRQKELSEIGIRSIVWNWLENTIPTHDSTWLELCSALANHPSTLLLAVSHAQVPGIPAAVSHVRGLCHLKKMLGFAENLKWIYLSTTGVYGNGDQGDWVDEDSRVGPTRAGSIGAYEAEKWLANSIPSSRRLVLRPAGIYGPNRLPKWESVRDEQVLSMDADSYVNLIHVDDLVQIIERVSNQNMERTLYCVSDCQPVLRRDYYECLSLLGHWPKPVFVRPSSGARGEGNKRVQSRCIRTELDYTYLFPTYVEGLKSLFSNSNSTS
ncbi:MAG: NAD-dependent epimerase/dehydratase family protein [Pirellula sp.]